MRLALSMLVLASACAMGRTQPAAVGPAPAEAPVIRAAELARVRCLLVAPFENGSDAPLAAEAATSAIVSEVPMRTALLPVAELRSLFRDTPLELPPGMSASLALELAEVLGADGVLYGSVEGRSRAASPELLVTVRLVLVGDRRLLLAQTIQVPFTGRERIESAARSAVAGAVRPSISLLGDAPKKKCFDPARLAELRRLALAEAGEARQGRPPAPPPAKPAAQAAAPKTSSGSQARAVPRTPRQADWAKQLETGERIVLDDVTFTGRSDELQRDGGLADLAVALLARPSVNIRLEGFVDATNDGASDEQLSLGMAQTAGRRLADLGVPQGRLSWVGRGGENPRLPNFTARGRAANRRLEVVIVR